MALLLSKYNTILDFTDKENQISSRDYEKKSTNTSIHLSNSFSTSDILNVNDTYIYIYIYIYRTTN